MYLERFSPVNRFRFCKGSRPPCGGRRSGIPDRRQFGFFRHFRRGGLHLSINTEGELRRESRRALPQVVAVKLGREPLLPALSLEQELHNELNQPRIHRTDGNLAETVAASILGSGCRIVYRIKRKLRVVEGVKEFAANFESLAFPNLNVFRDRHIPVVLPW
jgi:hypothetical protein